MSREDKRRWVAWIVFGVIWGVAISLYGHWQNRRGFERGADTAICAMAVAADGNSAVKQYQACRNLTDHNWHVEGVTFHKGDAA